MVGGGFSLLLFFFFFFSAHFFLFSFFQPCQHGASAGSIGRKCLGTYIVPNCSRIGVFTASLETGASRHQTFQRVDQFTRYDEEEEELSGGRCQLILYFFSLSLSVASGLVKLSDFGLSAELQNSIQMCATFVGTFKYMSPERIKNLEYGQPADVWR